MSDMKAFTVRDLNRSSAAVLATADRDGVALVRGRNGRAYEVRPATRQAAARSGPAFSIRRRERLRQLFPEGPVLSTEATATFDRMLTEDGRLL